MIVRKGLALGALAVGLAASAAPLPAMAQVVYQHGPSLYETAPLSAYAIHPYDESLGTSPSFEILPGPYGYAPAVRVVERCQYPNGWNVTDFDRDVNGIPAGIDHTCPTSQRRGRVRARF